MCVWEALLRDSNARAIYIFPTKVPFSRFFICSWLISGSSRKALAQDQLRALNAFFAGSSHGGDAGPQGGADAAKADISSHQFYAATLDGDTPSEERATVLGSSRLSQTLSYFCHFPFFLSRLRRYSQHHSHKSGFPPPHPPARRLGAHLDRRRLQGERQQGGRSRSRKLGPLPAFLSPVRGGR